MEDIIMKLFKNIGLLVLTLLAFSACTDKTPDYGNFPSKDVDFTYNVQGNEYTLDFYVVSTIQFTNTSSKSGSVSWDFGDGTTSTDANPIHKYAKSGTYNVTLKVDGVGQQTYPLLIYDITPVLSVTDQSADTLVINDVSVDLGIELPNPENLICKYHWIFPDGTMKADGTAITEFTGYSHADGTIDNPGALKFKNIGSQKITLQTWFDVNGENRRLDDSYVNVQVGFNKAVPTIYYAVYGGNIKAYKLIPDADLPAGTKNLPFDMGVSSGNTPLQLVIKNVTVTGDDGKATSSDYIYILDCGKQYTYINDTEGTAGDGKITVMSADGTYANIMVTNVGQKAFDDPYTGCADDTYLYYNDRNLGVRQLALTTRGAKETASGEDGVKQDNYLVKNQLLGYYSDGIAYGAISKDLFLDSQGVFWWPKDFNAQGIFRFTKSDIGGPTGKAPHPIVLANSFPRAITIDEARDRLYVWMRKASPVAGFNVFNLPSITETVTTADALKSIAMEAAPENSTGDEGIYTSQFALDKTTGNVYFGFRADSGEKTYSTGLYYYDFTAGKMVKFAGNTEKIMGVAINPRACRLF
jgi:hypothetical protein